MIHQNNYVSIEYGKAFVVNTNKFQNNKKKIEKHFVFRRYIYLYNKQCKYIRCLFGFSIPIDSLDNNTS